MYEEDFSSGSFSGLFEIFEIVGLKEVLNHIWICIDP